MEAVEANELARGLRVLGTLQRLIGFSRSEGLQLLALAVARRAAWVEDGCRLSDAVKAL